ncbi:MAG: hypothetical protein U5N58_11275 [Actinomycetota bacterium]|nr:hypothetical protein [Actinomycetota bacterium]
MPVVRWDPFSDLVQLRDEIGRWFEGVEEAQRKAISCMGSRS